MTGQAAQALIFADRLGRELAPLFQDLGPAMLPLAQKTPLHYCLDDLAETGVLRAVVVVSHAAEQVRAALSNGEPWGMQLEFVLSRGEEAPADLLRRFNSLLDTRFIAIRGDVLRTPMVKELQAACGSDSLGAASLDGRSVGLAMTDGRGAELEALAWPLPALTSLDMAGHRCNRIESLQDVLDANLDLAGGSYLGVVPAGLQTQDGVMVGRLSHMDASCVVDPPVSLGDHSSVHRSVRLYGPVVIGNNSFVDRDTQIRDSVILPNTYIGAGLDVKEAIIGEGLLIHPRDGLTTPIDDPQWVAPMTQQWRSTDASLTDRILGVALLLLSAPLWPVALLLAMLADGPTWLRRAEQGNHRNMRGQRREFTRYTFGVRAPLLRNLPGLLAVITGHLRLFGAPPVPLRYARDLPVQLESPPAGLIPPSALELDAGAPGEEVELFEVCFAAERSVRRELRCWLLALRTLVNGQAWTAQTE